MNNLATYVGETSERTGLTRAIIVLEERINKE